MEEKKTLSTKGSTCGCDHKSLLCWFIGFIVLVIVFCAGYKLGELKSYFKYSYYGYETSPMMRWGQRGYGMMPGWKYYDSATQPTTTDTTTTQK